MRSLRNTIIGAMLAVTAILILLLYVLPADAQISGGSVFRNLRVTGTATVNDLTVSGTCTGCGGGGGGGSVIAMTCFLDGTTVFTDNCFPVPSGWSGTIASGGAIFTISTNQTANNEGYLVATSVTDWDAASSSVTAASCDFANVLAQYGDGVGAATIKVRMHALNGSTCDVTTHNISVNMIFTPFALP